VKVKLNGEYNFETASYEVEPARKALEKALGKGRIVVNNTSIFGSTPCPSCDGGLSESVFWDGVGVAFEVNPCVASAILKCDRDVEVEVEDENLALQARFGVKVNGLSAGDNKMMFIDGVGYDPIYDYPPEWMYDNVIGADRKKELLDMVNTFVGNYRDSWKDSWVALLQ
jgi:hypothetical protein